MALDRRKVTMINIRANAITGQPEQHLAEDFVDLDHLDVYVTDAKTRWDAVIVGDELDHGPGGEDGHYDVHAATHAPEKV